jgi:preprotein translocase subunit SecA
MMDILKTGIGLRGYNQQDPLVEYKKESYNLFRELIQRIKIESMKVLQKMQIEYQTNELDEEMAQFLQNLQGKKVEEILANLPEIPQEMENASVDEIFNELEKREEELKAEFEAKQRKKKVKRNDPCPCGSGKKYKDCCGKSPKF